MTIRTNEWGLRGGAVPPRKPDTRRILFLGGSITLGWGVQEEDTISERVQRMFAEHGQRVEVLNGGIGNYNAERYVERFFTELAGLEPTDIVVQYFLRDAEHLDPGGGNFFLRHSELAWCCTANQQGDTCQQSQYFSPVLSTHSSFPLSDSIIVVPIYTYILHKQIRSSLAALSTRYFIARGAPVEPYSLAKLRVPSA